MAELPLAEFRLKYPKHQVVVDLWERNWRLVIPFFEFPEEIRKNRGSFPTQQAAIELLYLALHNVSKKWRFVQGWRKALCQFTIRWPERMAQANSA